MTIKILHLADVHLDHLICATMPCLAFRAPYRVRQVLQRALQVAVDEQVDAVTIAGDLFECGLCRSTRSAVLDQFRNLTRSGLTRPATRILPRPTRTMR
jgi:DNA repair exonuclease SbcCD nuclease subunit